MPPRSTLIVPINPGSDGDPSKWPGSDAKVRPMDDSKYRTTIGKLWMEEKGECEPGYNYVIDKLPAGYRHYGKTRIDSHVDYYVYGHPSGYVFDSTKQFLPHFISLMKNGGSPHNCSCKGCARLSRQPSLGGARSSFSGACSSLSESQSFLSGHRAVQETAAPQFILPPPLPINPPGQDRSEIVDEEGTPDIWRLLAKQLKDDGSIDVPISEPGSIDWTIESETLPDQIRQMQKQPSWMPRTGELVLFVRENQEIHFNDKNNMFQLWNRSTQTWATPVWEAGVVTETAHEQSTLQDLVVEFEKNFQVTYSGFRVEAMPEIGKTGNKSWSKRSSYVPLHNMRPFCFYREYLTGIKPTTYHSTINHAMTSMASFSVLRKCHFKGNFPNATIFCKGAYIGSELILVGDTVRLITPRRSEVMDILYVTSIKLKMLNIDAESMFGENDKNPPPWYTCLHISGVAFTTDVKRAHGEEKAPINKKLKTSQLLPEGLDGYGEWYYLHDPTQRAEYPFHRVLGRCYEDEAMMLWFPSKLNSRQATPVASFSAINSGKGKVPLQENVEADISLGLHGTLAARNHAAKNDPRIVRAEGKTWYWADSRVQQLDLFEIKNVDVGENSTFGGEVSTSPRQARHLDAMRKAKRARERGYTGPGGRALALPTSGLVAGGLNVIQDEEDDEEDSESDSDSDLDVEMIDARGASTAFSMRPKGNEVTATRTLGAVNTLDDEE